MEAIVEARVKTGDFIARLMMTYVGFAAFCVFTLLSPDRLMIESRAKLDMPFAGKVSFLAFMVVAPTVLIGMRYYLEIYLRRWRQLDAEVDPASEPRTVSPLKHRELQPFSEVALYLVLPSLLILFTWKAAARDYWGEAFLLLTLACTAVQASQFARRHPGEGTALATMFVGLLLAGTAWSLGTPHRGLDLVREDLPGAYLVRTDLRSANAVSANLAGAELRSADLTDADLTEANLRGADLSHARLAGAKLRQADLTDADLSGFRMRHPLTTSLYRATQLRDADLSGAQLAGADFAYTDLTGTIFQGARNIPDLSKACADPSNPPIGLPETAKRPESWRACVVFTSLF